MPSVSRIGIVQGAIGLFALALVGRAAQVQLWQGRQWQQRAERQHLKETSLPAPRGAVLDASGERLVESRELVRLAVNPREVRDRDVRALQRALANAGVPKPMVRRATDKSRGWVEMPGAFLPSDVAPARTIPGVHVSPTVERVSLASEGMRRVIGRVGPDGAPVDGLERALDDLLRGERGTSSAVRDARGRSFESPMAPGVAPRPGHSVTLTLSAALQDICERALADAVANMGASGGDVVVLDPHSGAVLAMAAWRGGRPAPAPTALTEPFEPGSTAKPFIAARLLELGRATPDEEIDTHNGVLTLEKRTIHDHEGAPRMSLRRVISKSSNVGIALFAQRLSAGEE
ncbi:MAG TPA: penicillin-binding transpeptidase domain-containing protein, partial [Gemmatimonadaceae bacterium]|nr:penicillin-binding transpeptidase domain-containing protein [Gemmatimonadaceae bacterium]